MKPQQILEQTGLSNKEATLYLAALQIGPATVLSLARTARIHRTVVYKMLEELVDKAVFTTTIVGKRKLYVAIEPKQLLERIKERERLLRDHLPELTALANVGIKKPKILYFEGKEQIKELFRTGLTAHSKEMFSFFPSKYMAQIFGKREMEEIITERIKRKIFVKTLRSTQGEEDFAGSDLTDTALREVRYIPDTRVLEMGIVIFDHTVNLFSPASENFGLQIESEAYAKLMRYFFDSLWQQSRAVEN